MGARSQCKLEHISDPSAYRSNFPSSGILFEMQSESGLPTEELEITRLIHERLSREDCMEKGDRETVAYRIAEIMVAAKRMYTTSLPRLTNVCGESVSTMDEDLEGLRMTFLHLRDLLHDFDSAYFESMYHEPPSYDYDGESPEEESEFPGEFDEGE